MKTTVTDEDFQIIKPLNIDFFNTSQFQTCIEIIENNIAFKLLMKINNIEINKNNIIISEIEFFIDTYFYIDDDQFINLEDVIILENNDINAANNCINIKFNVKNTDKINNINKIIFKEKIILEPNMGLHFIYFLNDHTNHGGGLCLGNKNCPIHVAGTTITKR